MGPNSYGADGYGKALEVGVQAAPNTMAPAQKQTSDGWITFGPGGPAPVFETNSFTNHSFNTEQTPARPNFSQEGSLKFNQTTLEAQKQQEFAARQEETRLKAIQEQKEAIKLTIASTAAQFVKEVKSPMETIYGGTLAQALTQQEEAHASKLTQQAKKDPTPKVAEKAKEIGLKAAETTFNVSKAATIEVSGAVSSLFGEHILFKHKTKEQKEAEAKQREKQLKIAGAQRTFYDGMTKNEIRVVQEKQDKSLKNRTRKNLIGMLAAQFNMLLGGQFNQSVSESYTMDDYHEEEAGRARAEKEKVQEKIIKQEKAPQPTRGPLTNAQMAYESSHHVTKLAG